MLYYVSSIVDVKLVITKETKVKGICTLMLLLFFYDCLELSCLYEVCIVALIFLISNLYLTYSSLVLQSKVYIYWIVLVCCKCYLVITCVLPEER